MAIENIMIKTDQVINFPICCTVNLKISAINNFLTQVQHQEHKENATPVLSLIHDLSAPSSGPTKELLSTDNSGEEGVLQSPFADCDFVIIQQQLQQMVKTTGSSLTTDWFLVLDAQSEETFTAVIVNVGEGVVREVRVAYAMASRYLSAASISHPSIDEMIEIAKEEGDGVLRD